MAELDRRLRRAGRSGGEDSSGESARTVTEETPGAGPESRGPAPARREADPATAKPVIAQAAGGPELTPIPPGGSDRQSDPGAVDELPPVEELAQRLSPEVRTVLDELFRAKWTEVKRLRPEDLRN